MKTKFFPVIFIIFLIFLSCTNDSESDLMNINTQATITYTNSIKPIMDSKCISCHGNIPSGGAPMSLTTYQNVKDAVLTRGLIERISKAQGAAGMMPYGGTRMTQSYIDQVIEWKNTGFKQ